MTYFAITGRLHGEDEDWCSLIQADTVEGARQAFIDETREVNGVTLKTQPETSPKGTRTPTSTSPRC